MQLSLDFDAAMAPLPMGLLETVRRQAIRLSPNPRGYYIPRARLVSDPWEMHWQRVCPAESRGLRWVQDEYRDHLDRFMEDDE